ncbi:hypothetical protein [Dysgonomonas sp. ZJ279]|uniref:hypothetical protein n=1 Tax=Dysgonomonas sp. ZJ279 TaxID=2709796 RepID=UPI0013EA3A03|nr:hypothetical protein [Dysgonomonas sp. ZJ279]
MIKKIFIALILSLCCIAQLYSQEKFTTILDSFRVKDKHISIDVNTDTTTSYFNKLDNKQSFMYGKNYKMLYLDSYGDFSLFGTFANEYIIGSLEDGLYIPVYDFYLFDHANKRCFSLRYNIAQNFSSDNGIDISIDRNLGLGHTYLNIIVELDKDFTALSSFWIVGLVAEKDTNQQKGDIIAWASYFQKEGIWYKDKVSYSPPYLKINDLSYTDFLNLIAKKTDCNEVSEEIICEDANCYEARGYLRKSK